MEKALNATTTAQFIFLGTSPFFPRYQQGGAECLEGMGGQDPARQTERHGKLSAEKFLRTQAAVSDRPSGTCISICHR
jgi:hypothetical protein